MGAVEHVAGIFEILRAAERSEDLLAHDLGEADDGVERGAQLVADIGQELGFRAAGDLGGFLGGEERFFAVLQLGDVGADADDRAVGGLVVADLDPSPVAQLRLEGGARLGAELEAVGEPLLVLFDGYGDIAALELPCG